MINKVLFATDYSEASLNALETAICIALKNNVLLQLLHVVETGRDRHAGTQAKDQAWQMAAEAIAAGVRQKHGIQVEIIIKDGYAGRAVVKVAQDTNADLIVIGKHGASGKREFFAGSTAYYILKNAPCAVLVVPDGDKWRAFEQVLFPLRTSDGLLQQYEFIKALNIARYARLEIVNYAKERELAETAISVTEDNQLIDDASSMNLNVSLSLGDERSLARDVLERSNYFASSLIVLSRVTDVIINPFYIGPFCQQLIHHAQVPVLYIR